MPFRVGALDQDGLDRQKQAWRDSDRARLGSGEVSGAELRAQNGFFSSLGLRDFRIASVGRRPLTKAR